jgi:hypothetical protein
MENPFVQDMLEMIEQARANYDRAIAEIMSDASALATSLRAAIGEVSPEQALTAWKRELIQRLEGWPNGRSRSA